jgi:hypothetical protein
VGSVEKEIDARLAEAREGVLMGDYDLWRMSPLPLTSHYKTSRCKTSHYKIFYYKTSNTTNNTKQTSTSPSSPLLPHPSNQPPKHSPNSSLGAYRKPMPRTKESMYRLRRVRNLCMKAWGSRRRRWLSCLLMCPRERVRVSI